MASQARAVVFDTDTLIANLFPIEDRPPCLSLEAAERSFDARYTAFFCDPDTRDFARYVIEDSPGLMQFDLARELLAKVDHVFERLLPCLYPNEALAKKWCKLAGFPSVSRHQNRDHLWMVVLSEALRDARFDVTIACESPKEYLALQRQGALRDITIL
ncbi:MAG: hypothetical protein SFX74_09825 [Fimbriimonadaceae bacterium]|nr:hypothetical protein [Fimbriimonadaceae bacterium]